MGLMDWRGRGEECLNIKWISVVYAPEVSVNKCIGKGLSFEQNGQVLRLQYPIVVNEWVDFFDSHYPCHHLTQPFRVDKVAVC